ncbi:Hint domain-containing protein [Brytella acorum]|uniref:Hint domain-containing protein n=1 Tax=Brytella acorum TaxID=2959299 RepID=A0AA35Y348_9PROT|nr:Hint domain-containing protein [Brytella acorum]CAI9122247.1 Hint domain-containing protein [Brytella acorum]
MTIYKVSSGELYGISLQLGDVVNVYAGGSAVYINVGADNFEYISEGGVALRTTISSGGQQDVFSGGVASGTIINDGDQLMAGVASGTIICLHGDQVVDGGGVAFGTTVSSGGVQYVASGGVASGTFISSGGAEVISAGGVTIDTTVGSGGVETVSGGAASRTTVSDGGWEIVHSGGVASGTIINGGEQHISSGGVASGAILNSSGYEDLDSGAVAFGTIIGSGAMQIVNGVASGTVVSAGGIEEVNSGGVTVGTIVSAGGDEYLNLGSVASGTIISSGGELDINYDTFASGTIVKSGGLIVMSDGTEASGIALERGGAIDLSLQYESGQSSAVYSGSTLTVTEGNTSTTLSLTGDYTGEYFALSADRFGGTVITATGTPCYCRGTRIATERGDIAVEELVIGDQLLTVSGAMRPIRWIGRRSYAGQFAATNRDVLPVLFRAGALGDAVPARDLMVSPLHAMYLEEVLVPAEALVNDVSILRMENVDRVDYFHLELDTHDVIFAEGAASETFVDDGSRGMFHNAAEFRMLYPDAIRLEARYCAPRVEDGETLAAINRALVQRATGGHAPVRPGPLRGYVDIVESGRIAGWAFDELTPEQPVRLRILDGDEVLGEIVADTYRADLAESRIGTGHHAFEFAVPGGLLPDRRHVIRILRGIDGQSLPGAPWVVEADPSAPPSRQVNSRGPVADHRQGFLDHASRNRIVGWARDPDHGPEPVTVQIFDNGQCIAQILANTYRGDLAAAGFDGGRFAFDILLPGGLSPLSRHVIQVFRAHDGAELVGSPAVIEAADSFDADLVTSVARAVDGLASGQERARVLSFLLAQAEQLRQKEADAVTGREAHARRRRLGRRFGPGGVEMYDGSDQPVRRALVIDEQLPDVTRDAGSCAIMSHMRALQALGFAVSFVAASEMDSRQGTAIRQALEAEGIMCWHAPFYASVEDVLRKQSGSFDVVYLHRISSASRYMALTRQHQKSAYVIYSVADLHHVRLERQAAFEERPELLAEARQLRLAECSAAWLADAVITHSLEEEATLRRLVPTATVHQVPWTVGLPNCTGQSVGRQGVLFLGHYGHAPNVDAAQWLVRDIMPQIWAEQPDITCILAGSAMPETVRRLADERVEVVGYVADLEALFRRVMVSVAPLRFGAGIKGKVLESLGHGVPCVMNDMAAEGIMLPGELHALQTTGDAASIARRILQLHGDRTEYERLSLAGVSMIRDQHGMEPVINGLRAAIGVEHLPAVLTGIAGR